MNKHCIPEPGKPPESGTLGTKEKKIKVEISRVLCYAAYKPFILTCFSHRVKRSHDKFSTLAELKNYYGIEKIIKTGKTGWAISSTGKKYEWPIYESEINSEYIF